MPTRAPSLGTYHCPPSSLPLCSPFFLVVSRACTSSLPVFSRVFAYYHLIDQALSTAPAKENEAMSKTNKYSLEVREHAVRLVQEARQDYPSLWSAVESIGTVHWATFPFDTSSKNSLMPRIWRNRSIKRSASVFDD